MNISLNSNMLRIIPLAAFVFALSACSMTEPLATDALKDQALYPQASVVIVRFESLHKYDPSTGKTLPFNSNQRCKPRWAFAAANDATGWNFRELDYQSMVYRTSRGSFDADSSNIDSGWVTFVVPQGATYLAVLTPRQFSNLSSLYGDCISALDFIDAQRFMLTVSNKQVVIYAGTIVDEESCDKSDKSSKCTTILSVKDENSKAKAFVLRYSKRFASHSTLQTQLLSVPLSHTIEIPSIGSDSLRLK